jgi:hypothetical protein
LTPDPGARLIAAVSNSDRAGASRRVPLLVLAIVLAAGLALMALEHHRTEHGPPALTAPAERAPPVAGAGSLPVAAPVPAR